MSESKVRVLCVDDEPNVLDGLRRHLHQHFETVTAVGSEQGLRCVEEGPPFAVIVSDLRMPGMDGIQFLSRAREISADTTRVLLTGNADLSAAISAVNEGNVFRFLTKPCPPANLILAIKAAAEQHRLVTSERVLLEETLLGSVRMLTEVLALANAAAFGNATRVKQRAGDVADLLGGIERWKMELAAMLSQVAYVTLPSETLERLRSAPALSAAEQAMLGRLPEVSERLIASIPRLEDVRAILRHQNARLDGGVEIPAGARILKCVLDLDALEVGGMAAQMAIPVLRGRAGWYDPAVLEALERRENAQDDAFESRELGVVELRPGMILIDDVTTIEDRLLVAHGQEVGVSLIERLRNFAENTGVKEPIRVLVPTRRSS